jgi:predicted phosphodiesterase
LCHGLGEDDMAAVKPDDHGYELESNRALWELVEGHTARFVINGHTHRAMLRTFSGVTILNAGALHPKHRPMCAIADFGEGYVQLYDLQDGRVTAAERWAFDRGSRPYA